MHRRDAGAWNIKEIFLSSVLGRFRLGAQTLFVRFLWPLFLRDLPGAFFPSKGPFQLPPLPSLDDQLLAFHSKPDPHRILRKSPQRPKNPDRTGSTFLESQPPLVRKPFTQQPFKSTKTFCKQFAQITLFFGKFGKEPIG